MHILCIVYNTLQSWGYHTIVFKDLKGGVPSSQKFDLSDSKLFNNIMYLHGNHVFRGKSKCQLNNWNSYVVVKGGQEGVLVGDEFFND